MRNHFREFVALVKRMTYCVHFKIKCKTSLNRARASKLVREIKNLNNVKYITVIDGITDPSYRVEVNRPPHLIYFRKYMPYNTRYKSQITHYQPSLLNGRSLLEVTAVVDGPLPADAAELRPFGDWRECRTWNTKGMRLTNSHFQAIFENF